MIINIIVNNVLYSKILNPVYYFCKSIFALIPIWTECKYEISSMKRFTI